MASRAKIAQRITELSHEDVAVRRKAALKLGDYGAKTALPQLCAALRDESWKVQRNAAIALRAFHDPAAVEALASVFIASPRKKKYRSVRKEALYALGQIGTEQALDAIDRVWREERDMRDVATDALGQVGLPAVPIVCRALTEGYATLTPNDAQLRFATHIVGHSLMGVHGDLERDAHHLLCAWLDTQGTEVFAAILATGKLSPHDKYICLEMLRRRLRFLKLVVYFRDTRSLCEQFAATDERAEVRNGARSTLDYAMLARGSERPLTPQRDELLRAAQAAAGQTAADQLLLASIEPEENNATEKEQANEPEEPRFDPIGLIAKALRHFKRS